MRIFNRHGPLMLVILVLLALLMVSTLAQYRTFDKLRGVPLLECHWRACKSVAHPCSSQQVLRAVSDMKHSHLSRLSAPFCVEGSPTDGYCGASTSSSMAIRCIAEDSGGWAWGVFTSAGAGGACTGGVG